MKITSYYSIFAVKDMSVMLARFSRTGSLKQKHFLDEKEFNYYVMEDASGNCTDFIEFKNKKVGNFFYAIRINVDDFDAMANILKENDYVVDGDVIDTSSCKLAIFTSNNEEPNVVLFEHKK